MLGTGAAPTRPESRIEVLCVLLKSLKIGAAATFSICPCRLKVYRLFGQLCEILVVRLQVDKEVSVFRLADAKFEAFVFLLESVWVAELRLR